MSRYPIHDELRVEIRRLAPTWRSRAAEAAERRALPEATVQELKQAGLCALVAPAAFGGGARMWSEISEAGRLAARDCPSTAWMITLVGGHAALAARLPLDCQRAIFAAGHRTWIASASSASADAVRPVEDGYFLNGTWRFCSGAAAADWFLVSARVDAGKGAPDMMLFAVPRRQVQLLDDWQAGGMRATGSVDIALAQVRVAPAFAARWLDLLGQKQADDQGASSGNPLACAPLLPYVTNWIVGPILGCAEGARERYITHARDQREPRGGRPLPDLAAVQARLAESDAELRCAGFLYRDIGKTLDAPEHARTGPPAALAARVKRDAAYLAELCHRAIQRLVRNAGSWALQDSHPLQRQWRDLQAMVTHIDVQWDVALQTYGHHLLTEPATHSEAESP